MFRNYRSGYYAGICLLVLSCSVADARIFGNRRGGGGDGNVVSNAPVAPANLDAGMPDMRMQCGPNGMCTMQPMQTAAPQMQVNPNISYAAPQSTVVRSVIVGSSVVDNVAVHASVDSRVDRLVTALEKRLGIEPEPAMSGNPNGMFNSLPIIEVVKKKQDGTVEDTVELNTMLWVKRQLGL